MTIDPSSSLPDGRIYVAVSDTYYDGNGNQGRAASATFTVAGATDVLVSNHGQTTTGASYGANGAVHAQGFTTGGNAGGYTLAAIGAVLESAPAPAQRNTVRAELWSAAAGGAPDSKVADLTVPATLYNGAVTYFEAPPGTALAAGTAYHFVLYTTGTYDLRIDHVTATGEDAGAAAGWSIADSRHSTGSQQPAANAQWTAANNPLRITVRGAAAALETAPAVSLSASPNPVPEGGTVTVKATLSRPLEVFVEIPLLTTIDSAEPEDLGKPAGSIGIDAGARSGTGDIPTEQDDDADDETFTVALDLQTVPEVAAGNSLSLQVTIDDDDGGEDDRGGGPGGGGGGGTTAAARILHAEPVVEGAPARFHITLDEPTRRRIDLLASTTPGTAAEGADYEALRRRPVTVAPGESEVWLEVATKRDAEEEADETFTVTLSVAPDSAPARVVRPEAQGTILDGPPPAPAEVPLLLSASDPSGRQGFVRVVNHGDAAAEVSVHVRDDAGVERGTVTFPVAGGGAFHFNSNDLEEGNADKGLEGSIGPGTGHWRLELSSDVDVEALAYVRHADGFLTSLHDAARGRSAPLATFNPGSNWRQVSRLRLAHRGAEPLAVRVAGTDDAGDAPGGMVAVELAAFGTAAHAADALESGTGAGTSGRLGDGAGKWRLRAEADAPFTLMGLMESPSGHLTNLTSAPLEPTDGKVAVPLFLSAADPRGRQGFLRVISRSGEDGAVTIRARDDSGMAYEPLELALSAGEAVQFNSDDLEMGNAAKGLTGSTGPAHTGDWWLELTGDVDYEVLAYARHADGFLTALHDTVPVWDGAHRVATFNPGSNWRQVSRLRLLNAGPSDVPVHVRGIDSAGAPSAGTVSVTVPAWRSVTLDAQALEAGGEGFEGSLGDGAGKWRLVVEPDGGAGALRVMSLMESPSGHLTNLSTRTAVRE